jgi:UDP-N-acetylmuramyl pentapeptide phosphotransferase/UDP-N-acetylglucosamine-1-phosphate transferase
MFLTTSFLMSLMVFIFVIFLINGLSHKESRIGILDHPNSRSLHTQPIPRTGGLALFAGVEGGVLATGIEFSGFSEKILALGIALLPLAAVSLLDDRYRISAKWRILIHLGVAVSLLVAGFTLHHLEVPSHVLLLPNSIASCFNLLFIIWMINLYNFMDGMDGFAGGMAVIGFTTLAWLGHADHAFMSLCLIVAAASAGFLAHNFPPAKIFMGDTGSTMLGFLAAACILWASRLGLFPFWVGLLVFSPFIVDATVTLLRRLLRGERVWEAHRSHYYQRLVLLGWGHRRTVLAEYVLMLACAGSALLAVRLTPGGQIMLIMTWALIYPLLMFGVGWLEQRRATVSRL